MTGLDFHTLYCDPMLHCLTWGPIFVQRWTGSGPTAPYMERMLELHGGFVDQRPSGTTFLLSEIVEPTMHPPNAEARETMRRHRALVDTKLVAAATVVVSPGFGGAMARTIISGLVLFQRSTCPHGICATTLEGFTFLLRYGRNKGLAVSAEELERRYRAAIEQD